MINVTKAYLPDKKKIYSYFDKIYEAAWLTNNGQFCQELERRLRDFLGVKHLILVSNGTLALQISYKALGIRGSAVTTPFSFVATTSSLMWEGIRPIFSDIDKDSWNLSPNLIEKAIEKDTTAILPVHVFGNPCEVEEIQRIGAKNNLKVIYDAAHAFGVKFKGESVLNWGDISILSFHATKLFHTIEGGAIITSDDEVAKKIRLLINFGITGQESIDCVGINCKMNEFQAVMGLCVLDEIDTIFNLRMKIWEFYRKNIPSCFKLQLWNENSLNNNHYFPVLFKSSEDLKKAQKLLNQKGIFPRRYFFPSLDTLNFTGNTTEMTVSRNIAGRILCLPFFPGLKQEEQIEIIKTIEKAIED